jgi:hypothetical protein
MRVVAGRVSREISAFVFSWLEDGRKLGGERPRA